MTRPRVSLPLLCIVVCVSLLCLPAVAQGQREERRRNSTEVAAPSNSTEPITEPEHPEPEPQLDNDEKPSGPDGPKPGDHDDDDDDTTTPSPPLVEQPAPAANSANFIVSGNQQCAASPPADRQCFFGTTVNFNQVCSPACYWGGLCRDGRCIKQLNSCIVFCPTGFRCSYGYCVQADLLPSFLSAITPFLYTDNALIQPGDASSQPLYVSDGTTLTEEQINAGVGGQTGQVEQDLTRQSGAARTSTHRGVAGLLLAVIAVAGLAAL